MAIISHTKSVIKRKGHRLLIALLLFLSSTNGFTQTPIRAKLDSLTPRQVWFAAQIVPGSGQFINKQYWKLPVYYTGMGTMLYFGYNANQKYLNTLNQSKLPDLTDDELFNLRQRYTEFRVERNLYYMGAGAFYVASVADALIVKTKGNHSPLSATVLSLLFPGMGQVYNQKIWKVPFVWGGLASLYYTVDFNQRGYLRFTKAFNEYPKDEFNGQRSETELIYYRDMFQRNRDLALIGLVAFYGLNIIDAYIDANFFNWDISDNLALNLEPAMLHAGSMSKSFSANAALGLRINLKIK